MEAAGLNEILIDSTRCQEFFGLMTSRDKCCELLDSLSDGATIPDEVLELLSSFKCDLLKFAALFMEPTEVTTSCVIVAKGNGFATASPEGVAAYHVCHNSNVSVDPPITPQEGRFICRPGEKIDMDDFRRIVKCGVVRLSVVPNPWGIEFHQIMERGSSSVLHRLVRNLLFAKNPVARSLPQETGGEKPNSSGEHPTTASSSRCLELVIQIEHDWLLDSGASLCMTGNRDLLQDLHDAPEQEVITANNEQLSSTECGRACGNVKLSGIRLFPGLALNLISPGILARRGCEIIMNGKGCTIKMGRRIIGKGPLLRTNVYSLDFLDGTLLESDCTHCNAHHAD